MPGYLFKEISNIIGGKFLSDSDCLIKHLVTDSRLLVSSADSVFFALKGERHNGHKYISELYYKRGFRNFVVEYFDESWKSFKDARFLVVDDTLLTLQQLAAFHRKKFSKTVIAITGSNGKTIVKEWLFQLLQPDLYIVRSPKSYNSQVGVPLSVWNLEENADLGIFEGGISKPGEMEKLEKIIKPNIGIITNISEAHQENFSDYVEKAEEKLKLFKHSDTIIFCSDHQFIKKAIKNLNYNKKKLVTWSVKKEADLQITAIQRINNKTQIKGNYNSQKVEIIIPFTDSASIENAIHCWLLLLTLGYNSEKIILRMQSLNPVAMRLEQVKGINNCTIINDSYNSDIHSLAIALDFLNQQNQHAKKTIILSDILESGKDETSLYQEVSSLLENKKINKLIGIGPEIFRNAQFFQCEKYFFQNTADFIEQAEYLKFNDEAILLKGARNFEFERITNILEQKVHRTVLEINLNCMMQNLNYFRSKLKADTKIMVMVKAFSYGSGSFEIANMLEYQKVDYLAVAFTDEGVSLRHAGISLPIVVMNPDEASFRLMIENNLQPEIYNFRVLSKFTEAVKSMLTEAYPVHIKLDTGMNRLGFTENEIVELCKVLKKNKYLLVQSVFSHLAASDEPKHDDFTKLQISRFYKSSNELINALGYPVIRHILNSAGIERFSESQFDMVRLGIGLYGISAIDQQLVKNVSTLKTRVLQIKKVPLNETVGYGRKGRADHEIAIAVIPVGYADGFNRKLGNGVGKIWLNEHYVSVIGNVCMDMTMVNITGVDVHEGDEVEIFGDHISIIEIAKQIDTIPYEVLTSVSNRVKRVYIQE